MTVTADMLRLYRAYPRLPPEIGGMERHIARLTEAQRAQGVDVVNIFNAGEPDGPAQQVLPGRNLSRIKPAAVRDLLFYAAARGTLRPVRDNRFTVLHVHGDWSAFLAARFLAHRLRPVVSVASIHAGAKKSPAFYRTALAAYDLLFATGYGDVRRLSKWTSKPVCHLPSAPLDLFFEPPARQAPSTDVIAIGNLLPYKKTDLLIACAARRPHLNFSIYGEGPERTSLEAAIAASGCSNVRLFGKADPSQIAAALHAARLFVSVSGNEGTPTAALEAMACGLPVVLTPSNDYGWLVREGINGYVTRGWDIEEILQKIDLCLADEDKRRAMAAANRDAAREHRWTAKAAFVTDKIIAAIEKAIR